MASAMARGTVRAVSFTSPLGTSAVSTPANAKTSSSDVRATSPAAGHAVTTRCSPRIANSPPMAMSKRGTSLATVAMVFRRAPSATPRAFTIAHSANVTTSTIVSAPPSAGTSVVTLAANTVATAAVAKRPSSHSMTPARKPAYGPSATPMYA